MMKNKRMFSLIFLMMLLTMISYAQNAKPLNIPVNVQLVSGAKITSKDKDLNADLMMVAGIRDLKNVVMNIQTDPNKGAIMSLPKKVTLQGYDASDGLLSGITLEMFVDPARDFIGGAAKDSGIDKVDVDVALTAGYGNVAFQYQLDIPQSELNNASRAAYFKSSSDVIIGVTSK